MNGRWEILATALAMAVAAPARATTFLYATGPVNLTGKSSGWVNARAEFQVDHVADTITISILNLRGNPAGVGQAISGLSFTLSHFTNATATPTITSERATRIEVDRMGRIIEVGAELTTDWQILPIATGTFDLCTICRGSGDPDELLIGGPAVGGRYTSANGSIAGNHPHNPFLLASGDSYSSTPLWTVRINGLEPATLVATTIFRFGTTFGDLTAEGYSDVPEPGTWAMIATCAGILIFVHRRRSKAQKV